MKTLFAIIISLTIMASIFCIVTYLIYTYVSTSFAGGCIAMILSAATVCLLQKMIDIAMEKKDE